MDNQTLLYIMTAFVVIAGLSMLLQLGTLFGIYRTAKAIEQKLAALAPQVQSLIPKVESLLPKMESILVSSEKIVDNGKQQIADITAKTGEILDSTKRQLLKIEEVVNDASGRAKVQLEKAEMVIDDTVSRAHETVAMVHNGITRPLREINGISAGVRAAIQHLARSNRPSVAQATHDEEMFI
jgi:hypothetical protein